MEFKWANIKGKVPQILGGVQWSNFLKQWHTVQSSWIPGLAGNLWIIGQFTDTTLTWWMAALGNCCSHCARSTSCIIHIQSGSTSCQGHNASQMAPWSQSELHTKFVPSVKNCFYDIWSYFQLLPLLHFSRDVNYQKVDLRDLHFNCDFTTSIHM